ncbi:MAG: cupin domain-containing protein [candidate division NC10 bacterium]|nr:cupin domain-containing protein [candidate division NC10 bacterium]
MNWINTSKVIRFSEEKLTKVSLFRTDRFMVDLYCLKPGQVQKPHVHEGIDKVYYIVEGEGSFSVGDEERILGRGEAVLASAGQEHGLRNPGPDPLVILVLMAPPLP